MKWVLAILVLAYIFNPLDILPDFLPGVGWLDDLGVLGFLGYYLYRAGYRGFPFGGGGKPAREQTETGTPRTPPEKEDALNPHQVLGIAPGAAQDEIRKAYRRLAAQYHPDKVAHLGEDLRLLAEKKFKAIQTAYDALRRS